MTPDKNGVVSYTPWTASMYCDDCNQDVMADVKLCDCEDCMNKGREEVATCSQCGKWLGEI